MFRFSLTFFLLTLATLFLSCRPVTEKDNQQDSDLKSLSPLDSQQMSMMSKVLDAFGRIESAAIQAHDGTSATPVSDSLTTEIKNALLQAKCLINYSKTSSAYGVRQSFLEISGTNCPVSAHFDSKYSPGTPDNGYSLTAQFTVKDAGLRTKNDIYELNAVGSGHYELSDAKGNVNIAMEGTAKSLTLGTLRISSSHLENFKFVQDKVTSNGHRIFYLMFPKTESQDSFFVELKSLITVKKNDDLSSFSKNGVEISEREFQTHLNKLGIILE